jgi:hypothetical protein
MRFYLYEVQWCNETALIVFGFAISIYQYDDSTKARNNNQHETPKKRFRPSFSLCLCNLNCLKCCIKTINTRHERCIQAAASYIVGRIAWI